MNDANLNREIDENAPADAVECDDCECVTGEPFCTRPTSHCDTCKTETGTVVNCITSHYCSARCARAAE